ncbi:HdeD family acid-resistance protein [Cetobacterium sp.]|uniref:HdeD family acid-resistance protein n=1 Tax=Cetobacterium sp. TaxID=2071632 RepID=UPI002FCA92E4
MDEFNKKIFSYLLFTGILFSIVGIFGIFSPTIFSIYLVYILAAFFLVSGVKNFTKGFQFRKITNFHWGLYIFLGALEIIISLSLLATPFASQIYMIIYAGIFMIFKGIFILLNVLFNRKIFPSLVSFSLGSGIIDVLFGFLLVALPFFSQQFIFLCIAWYILFSGANLILSAFSFKSSNK